MQMRDMALSIYLTKLYQTAMRKKFHFFVSDYLKSFLLFLKDGVSTFVTLHAKLQVILLNISTALSIPSLEISNGLRLNSLRSHSCWGGRSCRDKKTGKN